MITLSHSEEDQKKEKEKEQFRKFFENLQQLSIKIPFFEALEQMPKYAKFMKDLIARKGKTEETSKITLNERWKMGIDKAVADHRASISLMPYFMYARLDLGELKPTRMCIELANKSIQYPRGIVDNVIVKIEKFIFPVHFVVLDMKEDHKIPIILGRLFLATTHAMIDLVNKKISFELVNETITFDIEKLIKFSKPEDDECPSVDMDDKVVSDLDDNSDNLDKSVSPSDHDNWEPIRPTLFATNTFENEKQPPKLKELPSHLEYAFLNNNKEIPVIISSLLTSQEKESLLKVLTQHKAALAWKVADIKGINPSFCTHKILMEDNFKPVDAKPRLIRWVLFLQEFTIEIKDKKGTENLAADHLSRLENLDLETLNEDVIRDSFLDEHLMAVQVRETAEDPWYVDYANFLV
ncbi:putative nucleotidyltransferase, ribonuclease H [Tanacetum coccineum]